MLSLFRRYQKSVLLIVTIVICISFGWFYIKTDTGAGGPETAVYGEIYGRKIHLRDLQLINRHVEVAVQLQLPGLDQMANGASANNLMPYLASVFMVREESEQLGLAVTTEAIENYIKTIPAFQSNGKWDGEKFKLYAGTGSDNGLMIQRTSMFGQVENAGPFKLSRNGMTVADLYQIVGDYMLLDKLQALIGSGLVISDSEAERNYAAYAQKITSSVVSIPFSRFLDKATASDEEIKKIYDEAPDRFMTEEKKSFEFVAIAPEKPATPPTPAPAADGKPATPPPAPAEAPEKAKARAELVETLYNALHDGKSLAELATEHKLELVTVPPYSATESPEQLKEKNLLAAKLSAANADRPIPQPVKDGEVYYVARLKETIAPTRKPLEAVKDEISKEIKNTKAAEAAEAEAKTAVEKITSALAAGKSFAEAAEAAGLKAEDWPAISNNPSAEKPGMRQVKTALQYTNPKSLGKTVTTPDAVIIPYLVSREIEKSAEKAQTLSSMKEFGKQQLRRTVFTEWWKTRLAAAKFEDKTQVKESAVLE